MQILVHENNNFKSYQVFSMRKYTNEYKCIKYRRSYNLKSIYDIDSENFSDWMLCHVCDVWCGMTRHVIQVFHVISIYQASNYMYGTIYQIERQTKLRPHSLWIKIFVFIRPDFSFFCSFIIIEINFVL